MLRALVRRHVAHRVSPAWTAGVRSPCAAAHLSPLRALSSGWIASPSELSAHNHNAIVIDTGSADAFTRARVPGAVRCAEHADLKDASHPLRVLPPPAMASLAASLGIDEAARAQRRVIVYDAGNALVAARLWWVLRYYGLENVAVLDGGWRAYVAAGGGVATGVDAPLPPRSSFVLSPRRPMLAVADDVLAASGGGGGVQVIDARSPAEFMGTDARGCERGGRVPGAINVPFNAVLHTEGPLAGRYRDAAVLRALFAREGVDLSRPTITYCLAGMRAAVIVLALRRAVGGDGTEAEGAFPPAQLYDASMAEWLNDSRWPIARG